MKRLLFLTIIFFFSFKSLSQSDKANVYIDNIEVKDLKERIKFSLSKKQLMKIQITDNDFIIDSVKINYEFNKEINNSRYKKCPLKIRNRNSKKVLFYLIDNKCVNIKMLESFLIRNIWIVVKLKRKDTFEQFSFECIPE